MSGSDLGDAFAGMVVGALVGLVALAALGIALFAGAAVGLWWAWHHVALTVR